MSSSMVIRPMPTVKKANETQSVSRYRPVLLTMIPARADVKEHPNEYGNISIPALVAEAPSTWK